MERHSLRKLNQREWWYDEKSLCQMPQSKKNIRREKIMLMQTSRWDFVGVSKKFVFVVWTRMKSNVYKPDPNHVHMWCEIGIKSGLCFSVNGQTESSFVKHCIQYPKLSRIIYPNLLDLVLSFYVMLDNPLYIRSISIWQRRNLSVMQISIFWGWLR